MLGPVEADPHRAAAVGLLGKEPPKLVGTPTLRVGFGGKEEAPLLLQASHLQTAPLQSGACVVQRVPRLAADVLDHPPAPSLAYPEERCVEAVHHLAVLSYGEHVVRHLQKGSQAPDKRLRALASLQKALQSLSANAPFPADLQARQTPISTPAPDRHRAHP